MDTNSPPAAESVLYLNEGDSENLLEFFAVVLEKVQGEFSRWSTPVNAAQPFVALGLRESLEKWLSGSEPEASSGMWGFAKGEASQAGWPIFLVRHWIKFRDSDFRSTVDFCLHSAAAFDVQDTRQICRVLMTVLQTLSSRNEQTVQRNLELAGRRQESGRRRLQAYSDRIAGPEGPNPPVPLPIEAPAVVFEPAVVFAHDAPPSADFREPEPESGQPFKVRSDMEGASLGSEQLTLWYASHVGPHYAVKGENQDAVFAVEFDGGFVFALSDGVSTSMGSGYAAAAAVFRFCRFASDRLKSGALPHGQCLVDAARATQDWLDGRLARLLQHPEEPDLKEIRGDLGQDVALRLLQNTQHPLKRAWGAAMACTLIAGIIRPASEGGGFQLDLIRIGDGLAERVNKTGDVQVLLEMDSEETEISAALGPGPVSKRALLDLTPQTEILRADELLLISSDGLARGHGESVFAKITAISAGLGNTLSPENKSAARQILVSAAQYADDSYQRDSETHLFNDNLSLILIAPKGWR